MNEDNHSVEAPTQRGLRPWVFDLLLVCVLLLGVYLRFVGIDWGEEQYLHPDERFLVWVGSDISPVNSLGEYFDTANSSLNPHNRSHGFFVYGTLPLFMARYLVEWIIGHSGFNEMTLVGRPLSALMDLLTLSLVYLASSRLYNRRVALLAAAFYACAVLPIQLSHFYKEDTFTNFFTFLAIYFAVRIVDIGWRGLRTEDPTYDLPDSLTTELTVGGELNQVDQLPFIPAGLLDSVGRFVKQPLFWHSLAFGVALGCAVASKLNAAPVALVLPAAFASNLYRSRGDGAGERRQSERLWLAFSYLTLAALVSLLVFRLVQPYAFSGPGFFGVRLNPQWVDNIMEQRNQSTGDVDFPPALQWARRSKLFSLVNMVTWGLGLPLGILAWVGVLVAGWRILKGDWKRHILLWGWTVSYFAWQSMAHNPTMRYQLPIYPSLVIFAAWLLVAWYDASRKALANSRSMDAPRASLAKRLNPLLAILIAAIVLLSTSAWAYGFTRIYTRPITRVAASRWIYQNVPGPINLSIQSDVSVYNQPLPFHESSVLDEGTPFTALFEPKVDGELVEVYLPHVIDLDSLPRPKVLEVAVLPISDAGQVVRASIKSDFIPVEDTRGEAYRVVFETPLALYQGQQYQLKLTLSQGVAQLALYGSAPANESSWDDGLPLRMDGYDGYGGIYATGLNFEMYWDDNTEKLLRFVNTLEQADYIFISSNRQWGTTVRVPERYPLTIAFYRHLLGCPDDKDLLWCYRVAEVGDFHGDLGFELVQAFTSYPSLGNLCINDQFAEEAFTVYDHPKVMIFRKSGSFDTTNASNILGRVDLTRVKHVTPRQAARHPGNLMLPTPRWVEQQEGGTWSKLFNGSAWVNRSQALAVVAWYLALALLGWVIYPLLRLALRGLPDRGYPLARITGLLLLSYLVWLAGSLRIPFTRLTISIIFGILLALNALLFYRYRQDIVQEWRQRKRYYLLVEALFMAFFLLDLLIRLGNPDLWHPWKGGEKPMDFAYLNAVLKSTSFPPYDPWYAGGYLNYYYYGFVLVGVLIKWLGIVPAVAYNLVLPSVFAMMALGAFSLAWNLLGFAQSPRNPGEVQPLIPKHRWPAGLAGAFGMAVLGNLGTVRMIFQGYQKIAAPPGSIEGAGLFARWSWAFKGFFMSLSGSSLHYGVGDWYWIPSRAIPAPEEVEPITEFPFFTVLYGDPHAHLFALPITLLVLGFALSLVLDRQRRFFPTLLALVLGGVSIATLCATNTWDYYPYLALGGVAVAYGLWFNQPQASQGQPAEPLFPWLGRLPDVLQRSLRMALGVGALVALASLFSQPFVHWYAQAYNQVDIWRGTHTTFTAYFTHWGLFLFAMLSWMVWDTLDWMATTPVSALGRLQKYRYLVIALLASLVGVVILLMLLLEVSIAWFILPMAAWAGLLILRPNQPDARRFVLFLIGTGLVLTLMVEVIVLRGDIARMNTVFKFYLQVWTLFAVSAAACLGWLIQVLPRWKPGWRAAWTVVFVLLLASASLYPLLAGVAKINDRMSASAPITLDGMAFMAHATYVDNWGEMDLSQDYRAIRWLQENARGSPVIVEANRRDLYRWGSRFSIYTGLPGVVGWEWHQQQQRATLPGTWVSDRIPEVDQFYLDPDFQDAVDFLEKYNVRYIVLGQQERGHYPGPGLNKFTQADGILWQEVYRDADTQIFEVIPRTSD